MPFTHAFTGSNPVQVTIWRFSSVGRASALQAEGQRFEPVNLHHESLAQLVEHLTFNQRVTGSSPVRLIERLAGVAELADALDLGSSAFGRGGSSPFTRIIEKPA